MDSKLFLKVSQREERVERIKAFLVFPVAAFHLAVMSGCVGTDKLMPDTHLSCGFLKKGLDIPFAVGKTVCEFKTIIGLDTLHTDTPAGIPLHQPFQEVGGRVSGLLRIGRQEAEPGKTRQWQYIGTGAVLGQRYNGEGRPSHPPGFFLLDESSVGKALVCMPFSSSPVETSPACA